MASITRFNILALAQPGSLQYEALLLAASLWARVPGARLCVAEPQPVGAWLGHDTLIRPAIREWLVGAGAEIVPLVARDFGANYPHGNKIEALELLPTGEPFLFLDTDTLILGPIDQIRFDFNRPSASMRREGTWPEPPLYGPDYETIWRSLYDRFGIDYAGSEDETQPKDFWARHLYFNAGWFFGADPAEFGRRFRDWAVAIRDDPGDSLACQQLYPWLDQITLPLVIHSLGGGRPGPELSGLDGDITCHYRNLPLAYARESDAVIEALEQTAQQVKPLLRDWEPARKLIFQGKGRQKIRPLFADGLPSQERQIRRRIRDAGWWLV